MKIFGTNVLRLYKKTPMNVLEHTLITAAMLDDLGMLEHTLKYMTLSYMKINIDDIALSVGQIGVKRGCCGAIMWGYSNTIADNRQTYSRYVFGESLRHGNVELVSAALDRIKMEYKPSSWLKWN